MNGSTVSRARHGRRLVALVMASLLAVVLGATPSAAANWVGSFTAAYATVPNPVGTHTSTVRFDVSPMMIYDADIRIFNSAGTQLKHCDFGSACALTVNPGPGVSATYYAELWVIRAGSWVYYATSNPVTVTDPGWTGGFTAAYATVPNPLGTQTSMVRFDVSTHMSYDAQIRIFTSGGSQVRMCEFGSYCGYNVNPGPGVSSTFYAESWVLRAGTWVYNATSSPVTVTDPGWTGGFTAAYATVPLPTGSQTSMVRFDVSTPMSYDAQIRVFTAGGSQVRMCDFGSYCGYNVNPGPGVSSTFYAESWVLRAGTWVYNATSEPVSVTDPGWTGNFTSATAMTGDHEFFGASSATFTWNQPLQYVRIDIVDSLGEVLHTCNAAGTFECTAGAALGPDEIRTVHAEARLAVAGGGYVIVATSSSVQLTGMDADGFARFILAAPVASLPPLLGTARAAQATEIRAAVQSETFCMAIGAVLPTNYVFRSTTPDATLLCIGGTGLLLGYLIGTMGVDLALDIMSDAAQTDGQVGAPSYDPNERAETFDDPDCYHFAFDGRCLDFPDLEPEPELLADADGARIPPPLNCMSDAARDHLLATTAIESHHIITRYANQAPPGASDVLVERHDNVDALQAIAARYQLGINAPWNTISIPHAGPHPNGYHRWLLDQADLIDITSDGDVAKFLSLWDELVRKTIANDPTIVRKAYWECYGA